MAGDAVLPDRKGYNFDGCSPGQLTSATVEENKIVFPGGATYRVLVLPVTETMTPALLTKIKSLIEAGATVVGPAPRKSPGLSGYPDCDKEVQSMAQEIWGENGNGEINRTVGKGKIISGGAFAKPDGDTLYPPYEPTAALLKKSGLDEDFASTAPIRYTHRTGGDWDLYFVSNRTDQPIAAECTFRSTLGGPELWDPMSGDSRALSVFHATGGSTVVPLEFAPDQSYFICFARDGGKSASANQATSKRNFSSFTTAGLVAGPWKVEFNPERGGPASINFTSLDSWTDRFEQGIRHYSGIGVYSTTFDLPADAVKHDGAESSRIYMDLGKVYNLAQVRLNGKDLGVVWTAPWRGDITDCVQDKGNELQIAVANLWANRLIGDQDLPDDEIKNNEWPDWVLKDQPRPSKRISFSTYQPYKKDSPLQISGLLGPVSIMIEQP